MKLIVSGIAVLVSCLAAILAQNPPAIVLPSGSELILKSAYTAGFSCEGRIYGYYADIDNNCQIFHVCVPISNEEGIVTETLQYSFMCGNKTTFNQEYLTCGDENEVDCSAATALYHVNERFGIIEDRN